ncbi:hypothetical protein [Kitasatospora sp. NBC_01266]|uniref:hypothetical protein n=1 Tax=Kitasatospora sp. NBC_01266 TaxID=2903572 RepID=UPI002E311E30|nr:hypothetical protein [Kitasatospora sp. NBC_01266]
MHDCKKVLVVIHTQVYGMRIKDLLVLFHGDLRVSVVFTVAPHAFNDGTERVLAALGGTVLPWQCAIATEFDLILTAGSQGMEQLRGPLVRVSHGAGHISLSRPADGPARAIGSLSRSYLTWDGKLVPRALALAHRADLDTLADNCPEALPIAEVVGDGGYDRLAAGLPHRDAYRQALGLAADERFVLICSTWGRGSAFHRLDSLLPRLLTELPGRQYRTALMVHPNVFSGHGSWQVRSWLGSATDGRLALIAPGADWQPLLIAADFIIGDHGSVTLYGALTGAPILLAQYPYRQVNQASPAALLARTAPALSPTRPLPEQLAYAAEQYRPQEYTAIADLITSEPGAFNRNMRRLLYRILELGEPAHRPETEPLALPKRLDAKEA